MPGQGDRSKASAHGEGLRSQTAAESFYLSLGGGRFSPTEHTAGPWTPDAQHFGPPSALLVRARGYLSLGGGRVSPTEHTAGPGTPDAQHFGPPSALLVRALEGIDGGDERLLARVTVEILGPA